MMLGIKTHIEKAKALRNFRKSYVRTKQSLATETERADSENWRANRAANQLNDEATYRKKVLDNQHVRVLTNEMKGKIIKEAIRLVEEKMEIIPEQRDLESGDYLVHVMVPELHFRHRICHEPLDFLRPGDAMQETTVTTKVFDLRKGKRKRS